MLYFNILVLYVVGQSSRVKLVVARLIKILYTFSATEIFITVFARARQSPELHGFIPHLYTRFQKCSFNTLKFCGLVSSRSDVAYGVLEIGDLGGGVGREEHAFVTKNKKSVHCRGVTVMRS